MLKTNLLTIALPVYERKEFFLEALKSALNQTVKCNIIVVDNASTHDFFAKICKEKEIEYFKNEKNIGMFPNWNKCFEYATTEYVLLLGDDDILDITYVEKFLKAKEKYPNLDIYFTDFQVLRHPSMKLISHDHMLPFGYMKNGINVIEYGIKYGLGFPVITSAIRKSKFSGFYSLAHGSNDWVWIYENISDLEVFGENKILLKYRKHGRNDTSNVETNLKCYLSIWYLYKMVFSNYLSSNPLLIKSHKRYLRFYSLFYLSFIPIKELKTVLNEKNKYSENLRHELEDNLKYRIYLLLPLLVRKHIIKILKKTRLV